MRKVVSLLVFATLLAGAFSLAYAIPAFADLKAVVTIICNAYTDTVVLVSMSSNSKKTFPVASDTFCTNFMVSMDALGWHVIHDMRTGGAWFDTRTVPDACTGSGCYELIFLHD